jgi:hypothetical protein
MIFCFCDRQRCVCVAAVKEGVGDENALFRWQGVPLGCKRAELGDYPGMIPKPK